MRDQRQMSTGQSPAPQRLRFDFLDAIRGLAILMVFVYHALYAAFLVATLRWGDWMPKWSENMDILCLYPFTLGRYGVAVFFAVSGFCIHLSYEKSPGWKPFWIRRIFRIYPPYLVAMLVLGFLELLRGNRGLNSENGIQIFSHLLLVHNLSDFTLYGINGSFWTIALEMQLYLLYPLLRSLVKHCGWSETLIILGVVEIGIRLAEGILFTLYNQHLPVWIFRSPLTYWFSWSLGAYVANVLIRGLSPSFSNRVLYGGMAVVVLADLFKPAYELGFPAVAMMTSLVCIRWAQRSQKTAGSKRPDARWIRHIHQTGVFSYSIYLLHQPILQRMPTLVVLMVGPATKHPVIALILGLVAWVPIYLISGLYHRYLELPSISWGRSLLERFRTKPS